jgi:uncharacterized protein (DUF1684 family)
MAGAQVTSIAQSQHAEAVQHYRDSVDRVFSDPEQSILSERDLVAFRGLHYFDYNDDYRVKATFSSEPGQRFSMKTTTDRLPEYEPVGKLHFAIYNQPLELTVYRNVALTTREGFEDHLFVPFTDLTNGSETYEGGRYLDFRSADLNDPVYIDFNRCYNPYCVYSKKYSCPIPPQENHLNVAIEAGVKRFSPR